MAAESDKDDDGFAKLKPHIPEWKLDELGLSKSDRHILGTMDILEQKMDILTRDVKRLAPIERLYQKLSSVWAVLAYFATGLFALAEAIKFFLEFKK